MSGRVTGGAGHVGGARSEADTNTFTDLLRRGSAGAYRDDACGGVEHHDGRNKQGHSQGEGDLRHEIMAGSHARAQVMQSFTGIAAAVAGIQSQMQKALPRLESLNREIDPKGGAADRGADRSPTDGVMFAGAEGGSYDIKGEPGKVYNILSDRGIQVNAKFDVWHGRNDATRVRDVGISLGEYKIEVRGNGDVLMNGARLELGDHLEGALNIAEGRVNLRNAEYDIEFKQTAGYVNDIYFTAKNARADGVMPHGMWGNTLDGDGLARHGDTGYGAQGGGALVRHDGQMSARGDKDAVSLYQVGNLFDTAFKSFNQFDAQPSGGGFEAWLNGVTFEWSNFSLDFDVMDSPQPGTERINQSLMHYGVERLRYAVTSLQPLVDMFAQLVENRLGPEQQGPVNALRELLKLLSQMVELITVASHNGGSPAGSKPLQAAGAEVSAALEELRSLKPLLTQLETLIKKQPGAGDFGESRAPVSVEVDLMVNADLHRGAGVRDMDLGHGGVMTAGQLQGMMLDRGNPGYGDDR